MRSQSSVFASVRAWVKLAIEISLPILLSEWFIRMVVGIQNVENSIFILSLKYNFNIYLSSSQKMKDWIRNVLLLVFSAFFYGSLLIYHSKGDSFLLKILNGKRLQDHFVFLIILAYFVTMTNFKTSERAFPRPTTVDF